MKIILMFKHHVELELVQVMDLNYVLEEAYRILVQLEHLQQMIVYVMV